MIAIAAAGLPARAQEIRRFEIAVGDTTAAKSPRAFRVLKGEEVVIALSSAQPGTVHLHGYRLEARLAPPGRSEWRFVARATGRFRIEWHPDGASSTGHHGPPLATLDVLPR